MDGNETVAALATRVLQGEPRAVARAISLVEAGGREGHELIARIFPNTGRAYLVGVTGAPGTGKSTLVDRLIAEVRRAGQTAGVIAVDPTSPFTGGAVLGDRVRMGTHAGDRGVFIRSMATRGHLGGLARATSDAALILDAAGMDVVLIETVGVGQDEVDIVSTADVSIVLLVPGTGDELQALKAGVMEIADIFVVNKADREGADRAVQAIAAALALKPADAAEWTPPILKTEATSGAGTAALWAEVARFRQWSADRPKTRRHARYRQRIRDALAEAFMRHVEATLPAGELDRLVEAIEAREIDPYSTVARIIERVLPQPAPGSRIPRSEPR